MRSRRLAAVCAALSLLGGGTVAVAPAGAVHKAKCPHGTHRHRHKCVPNKPKPKPCKGLHGKAKKACERQHRK
ncbi:MAG: hypothetical protein E6G56_13140 [Actinobacteria bacterium]|nr:MAG: hypothetical protein E6G56_13140 [Actinomycetota bacterium]